MAMVKSGSRNENPTEQGLAHFTEHMAFKGARHFKNTHDLSSAVDSVGADFNAYTAEEITGYYIKVAKEHIGLGLDVLTDLAIYPKFPSKEIEKEKGVIVEEINMYEDMPRSKAQLELGPILYPHHPLGWSIAGTKKTVNSLARQNFLNYHQQMYAGKNMTVILSGSFADADVSRVEREFKVIKAGQRSQVSPPITAQKMPQVKLITRSSEQTHVAMGIKALNLSDPRHFAYKVLSTILGGNMSSRLFINLRDRQGLCYYIHSSTQSYTDCGHLEIDAGFDNKRVEQAISSIGRELVAMRDLAISDRELTKGKDYLIGRIKLSLEDSEEVAEYFISQQVLEEKILTPEQAIEEIKSVTIKQVKEIAGEIFQPQNFNLSLVGPFKDKIKIIDILSSCR